jgi:hypothetical protein
MDRGLPSTQKNAGNYSSNRKTMSTSKYLEDEEGLIKYDRRLEEPYSDRASSPRFIIKSSSSRDHLLSSKLSVITAKAGWFHKGDSKYQTPKGTNDQKAVLSALKVKLHQHFTEPSEPKIQPSVQEGENYRFFHDGESEHNKKKKNSENSIFRRPMVGGSPPIIKSNRKNPDQFSSDSILNGKEDNQPSKPDYLYGFIPAERIDCPEANQLITTLERVKQNCPVNKLIDLKLNFNKRNLNKYNATLEKQESISLSKYIEGITAAKKSLNRSSRLCKLIEKRDTEDSLAQMLRNYEKESDMKSKIMAKTYNAGSVHVVRNSVKPAARWNYALAPRWHSSGELEFILSGGIGVEVFSDYYTFLPSKNDNCWSELRLRSNLLPPRIQGHSMCIASPSQGYIFGGNIYTAQHVFDLSASLYLLTFRSKEDVLGPPMSIEVIQPTEGKSLEYPQPRRNHTMVYLSRSLLVLGGIGDEDKVLNDLWRFDVCILL